MKNEHPVEEAQVSLPRILREAEVKTVIITRRDKAVGNLLSSERFEAVEIMSNPLAM